MSDNGFALVVDDDPDLIAVHVLLMQQQGYEVLTAANGQEALNILRRDPSAVDLILSDIVMPEMDGYEFCKQAKDLPDANNIPFVFVSQLTTLEEIIKGYSVGADDYITKPISQDVLTYKVQRLRTIRDRNRDLAKQISESAQVAMQAMTYSSDLGQVLEFYKNTFNAESFDEVARLLFDVTSAQGLHATLQILTPREVLNFSDQGEVSPLEANVIEMSRPKARFFDFGPRTVINYADFSLMIKNMPLDDPERYGITKDTLGTLCNAIESRVQFLLYQNASQRKQEIVNAVTGALEDINNAFTNIQNSNMGVIQTMMDELDDSMMNMGLTSSQENQIRGAADRCLERSKQVFEQGVELYDMFEKVQGQLETILSGRG